MWDMVLLKTTLDGRQVDTSKWFICKLLEIRDNKVEIQFAMIVIFITLNLEITFHDSDIVYLRKFKATHKFNVDALSKIKIIKRVQNGR